MYALCDILKYILKEVIAVAKSASMYIRIDPQVKSEVEAIYSQYGMSVTDAINVFLYTSRIVGGLPFDLRHSIPNSDTLEAMKEGNRIIKSGTTRFNDTDDMFRELKA
jgi:DNA-damage-inducible protein J